MGKVYSIQTPDGQTIKVEGPEDATDDELIDFARAHIDKKFQANPVQKGATLAKPAPLPSGAHAEDAVGGGVMSYVDNITMGALDELGAVVDSVGLTSGRKNIWNGSSFVDAWKDNQQKNERLLADARGRFPKASIAGQAASLFSPMGALGLAGKLKNAPKLARVGAEVAQGTVYGFNSGSGSVGDRAVSAAEGGLTSLGVGAALRGAGRVISPTVAPAVAKLRAAGIPLTVGQIRGGMTKALEDKLMSIPGVGDLITANRRHGVEAFQRAQINQALEPIKARLPSDIPAGRDAVSWAQQRAGTAYDDALSTIHVRPDPEFATGMSDVRAGVGSMAPDQADDFERVLRRHVGPFTSDPIDGRHLQKIKIGLNDQIGRYRKGSPRDQEVADALEQVRDEFMGMASRQAPEGAGAYRAADAAFANMVPVNRAAAKNLKDGVATPLQFSQAVREADRSARKSTFARGDARMQDLADAGADVLPAVTPDSGTPGRLLANGVLAAATGGGASLALGPGALIGAGAAALPYAPGGRQFAEWMLAGRQGLASKKARALLDKIAFPAAVLGPRVLLAQPPE